MKIKLLSGGEIDTDKLNDKEAEIAEAIFKLNELCKRYNVTIFTRALLDSKFIAMQYFTENEQLQKQDIVYLLNVLGDFIEQATGGKFKIVPTE